MAQNRLAETGVNAASKTATRQKHANSLRKEIIEISRTVPFYTRCSVHPFKCGSNSLNAADEEDRINS